MATITYDNASPAAGDELNADEQDSLRVGEELAGQQEELLAGKFKSAEDLARAYQELEAKLGSRSEDQAEEAEPEEEEKAEPSDFLERLYAEAMDDSSEEYSKELMDELRQMDVEDLAQMYLEYRAKASVDAEAAPAGEPMSREDESAIMNAVGGAESYNEMLGWAKENLSEQEIDMYDQVMELGNPLAAFFAAQALAYRFNDARGSEGEMLSGRAPSTSGNVFRSQAELLEALSDPRYDRDPAYRQDVALKLERSEGVF